MPNKHVDFDVCRALRLDAALPRPHRDSCLSPSVPSFCPCMSVLVTELLTAAMKREIYSKSGSWHARSADLLK